MKFDSIQAVEEFYKAYAHEVGFPTNKNKQFWADLNKCVWGSETQEEFEM
jgi:hypothetical protein